MRVGASSRVANLKLTKEASTSMVKQTSTGNEVVVNVVQFFRDYNDKADIKLLQEALKYLKEETEYLRNEVRNSEKEITDRKEKCSSIYDDNYPKK